jgi:hypothetical protein
MLAQQPVHLAGHVGGEALDAAVLHLDPFRMSAGRADQSMLDARTQDQRFLATHHVGCAERRLAEQAGDDVALPAALQIHRYERLGDFGRACRAGGVRRLDPAFAASHHADEKDRCFGLGFQPVSTLTQEDVAVLTRLQS